MSFTACGDNWKELAELILDKKQDTTFHKLVTTLKGLNLYTSQMSQQIMLATLKRGSDMKSTNKHGFSHHFMSKISQRGYDSSKHKNNRRSDEANQYGPFIRKYGNYDSNSKRNLISNSKGIKLAPALFNLEVKNLNFAPTRGSVRPTETHSQLEVTVMAEPNSSSIIEHEVRLQDVKGEVQKQNLEEEKRLDKNSCNNSDGSDRVIATSNSASSEHSYQMKIIVNDGKHKEERVSKIFYFEANQVDKLKKEDTISNINIEDIPRITLQKSVMDEPSEEAKQRDKTITISSSKSEENKFLTVQKREYRRRSKSTDIKHDNLVPIKPIVDPVKADSFNAEIITQTQKSRVTRWYAKDKFNSKKKPKLMKKKRVVRKSKSKNRIKRKFACRSIPVKHKFSQISFTDSMDSQIKKVMRKLSFDPKRRFKKLEIISLSALRKSKNKQKRETFAKPTGNLISTLQFFPRDYSNKQMKGGSFLQLISQPVRIGSKDGSARKILSSGNSTLSRNRRAMESNNTTSGQFAADFNFQGNFSRSSNKL